MEKVIFSFKFKSPKTKHGLKLRKYVKRVRLPKFIFFYIKHINCSNLSLYSKPATRYKSLTIYFYSSLYPQYVYISFRNTYLFSLAMSYKECLNCLMNLHTVGTNIMSSVHVPLSVTFVYLI